LEFVERDARLCIRDHKCLVVIACNCRESLKPKASLLTTAQDMHTYGLCRGSPWAWRAPPDARTFLACPTRGGCVHSPIRPCQIKRGKQIGPLAYALD
jgi:hypothetical protein